MVLKNIAIVSSIVAVLLILFVLAIDFVPAYFDYETQLEIAKNIIPKISQNKFDVENETWVYIDGYAVAYGDIVEPYADGLQIYDIIVIDKSFGFDTDVFWVIFYHEVCHHNNGGRFIFRDADKEEKYCYSIDVKSYMENGRKPVICLKNCDGVFESYYKD